MVSRHLRAAGLPWPKSLGVRGKPGACGLTKQVCFVINTTLWQEARAALRVPVRMRGEEDGPASCRHRMVVMG
jgi:hypothetical protein